MRKNLVASFLIVMLMFAVSGCGGGGGGGDKQTPTPDVPITTDPTPTSAPTPTTTPVTPIPTFDYTTTVSQVTAKNIVSSIGGTVQVDESTSYIDGVKLTIPAGALSQDTNITMGEVNNPPVLPEGLNFVGVPVDLGPDGTAFSSPATIEIPFHDSDLSDAGVSSKTALKVYYFDKSTETWSEAQLISIDTVNNIAIAQVNHFSYYAITGMVAGSPKDLGTPQSGDLLYKLTFIAWAPGHVGIYTGEKTYPGTGLASDDVIKYKKYNVVEATPEEGVHYSYYDIPNVSETYESSLKTFNGSDVYMGAREPADFVLTSKQRQDVVAFVEDQVGKPYAWLQTLGIQYGMLEGSFVKGQLGSFNCVGLAEKAYEEAGVNNGNGLTSDAEESTGYYYGALTPAEHYNKTKPAGGTNPVLSIVWSSLTPNSGTECTEVLVQISVSHTDGLSQVDSVTYVTDDGYTNPNISINDSGTSGDKVAGDGIYSVSAPMGGNASQITAGLTFTVNDKLGKSATTHLVYTYTGTCYSTSSQAPAVKEVAAKGLKTLMR